MVSKRPPNDLVLMGRLAAPYGVKGWIRIQSFTEVPGSISEYKRWWLDLQDEWRQLTVDQAQIKGDLQIVKFKEINQREAVSRLNGVWVAVEKKELPRLPQGELYWHELTGFSVTNQSGEHLGIVDHLFESGAQPVIVTNHSGGQRLIPWVGHVIQDVDKEGELIVVDWEMDY